MSSQARAQPTALQDFAAWLATWLPVRDFLYLDVRSLALLRILLGVVLLCDWADRLPDLAAHYSDDGLFPRQIAAGQPTFLIVPVSVHVLHGATWYQALLAGLAFLAALALLAGYHTRLATLLSWFLLVSVHARNPALLQGGDVVLRMMLFWGLFLPLGAVFSLDAARARGPADPWPPWRVLNLASFAYIAQVCLLYWFAAAWKWDPEWRTEGTAVFYALNVDHLTTRFGRWLLNFPTLLRVLTHATIVLETVGPALLFLPFAPGRLRLLAIASFCLFHIGLGMSLVLSNFPWVCCVLWLALLPSDFWDWLANRWRTPGRAGLRIYYDHARPRCARAASLLRTFLVLPGSRWLPLASEPELAAGKGRDSWVVVDHEGKKHTHFDAFLLLVGLSPLWRPAGYLLGSRRGRAAGEALYRRLATPAGVERGARSVERTESGERPTEEAPYRLGPVQNAILGFCLAYVVVWNLGTLASPEALSEYFPPQAHGFGKALGLDQNWGLFAPRVGKFKGWFVIVGYLRDGRTVDLMRDGAPIEVDPDTDTPRDVPRPALVSDMYPNGRWRKYMMNLPTHEYYPTPHYYCDYLCRAWNAGHTGGERLEAVIIWFMHEELKEDGAGFEPPTPVVVYPPPRLKLDKDRGWVWDGLRKFYCGRNEPPADWPPGFSVLLLDPKKLREPDEEGG